MTKIISINILIFFVIAIFEINCAKEQSVINDGYGDYLRVPAGEFRMGDNFDEGNSDEIPVHTVYLTTYYIGKYKITNGEYKKFIDDGGYLNSVYWNTGGFDEYQNKPEYWNEPAFYGGEITGNEKYPVVGVSWFEAAAYCSWLSEKTGRLYRLPAEAEWEKAARGIYQKRYAWGDNIDERYANYDNGGDRKKMRLTPVGYYNGSVRNGFVTKSNASPYGAYDMTGNISEWCYDWYDTKYYSISPKENPMGPESGSSRVLRGGGYVDSAYYQRAAGRHKMDAHYKSYKTGFRCVCEK